MFIYSVPVLAEDFKLGTYDLVDTFIVDVLKAALDAADGDHQLSVIQLKQTQARSANKLADGSAQFNVYYTGHNKERERLLTQIDFPLTRGLLGMRVLFIHPDKQTLFGAVNTLDDLKHINFGSGPTWPDTVILKKNGLTVVTALKDNLPRLLMRKRIDAYPRAVSEWQKDKAELQKHFDENNIMLEPSVLLAYRSDLFFYLNKEDKKRADIIRQGLRRITENGVYTRMFNEVGSLKGAFTQIMNANPTVITLHNPIASERVKAIPSQYWQKIK